MWSPTPPPCFARRSLRGGTRTAAPLGRHPARETTGWAHPQALLRFAKHRGGPMAWSNIPSCSKSMGAGARVDSPRRNIYNVTDEVNPMPRVEVRSDESLEKALRRFKRMLEREGILKALKAKKHYEKPSERKRREMRQAISRRARNA